jgi:hemoglobin
MSDVTLQQLTPFIRIGGTEQVSRLVEAFYLRMDRLPEVAELRAIHRADLTSTKEVLVRYLGEWLGGPALYSAERGHPRLRMRHSSFAIGPEQRDSWMLCMRGALDEVVTDAELHGELLESFTKLADWVRNDKENPHDNRHASHHR